MQRTAHSRVDAEDAQRKKVEEDSHVEHAVQGSFQTIHDPASGGGGGSGGGAAMMSANESLAEMRAQEAELRALERQVDALSESVNSLASS